MQTILSVLIGASVLYQATAFFSGGGPAWDNLRTTWNLNPFSNGFTARPRDLFTDSLEGFVLKENYCNNKNSPFLGKAYWSGSDPTIVLLYDVNGFVAGMQSFAPAASYSPPKSSQGNAMVQYGNFWVLTVYFVDPSIICTTGRTQDQYNTQGTGSGLWIQNGTTPLTSVVQIPMNQNDLYTTQWTQGKCFYTMGQHYWYNLSPNMNCENFFPYCLLYNSGKLDGFCFAFNSNFNDALYDSPHPTPSVLSQFMNPVPNCMNDNNPSFSKYSTIHVYMIDWARSTFC